ncbi:hypothetical protein SAMN05519104_5055 [Rhizobiales bacterium GAS188]|nr:hypothetical protein SAMN05519104_5055 [Rhizobiales bacterium GAS188]
MIIGLAVYKGMWALKTTCGALDIVIARFSATPATSPNALPRDDTAEEAQHHLGQVLTTLHEFVGGRFETVLSSMAMFVFGGFPDAEYDTAYAQTVSACDSAVLGELGPDAKVVYGQATCLEGGLWAQPHLLFRVTIPEFGKVISALVTLEFGSSLNMELPWRMTGGEPRHRHCEAAMIGMAEFVDAFANVWNLTAVSISRHGS